MDNSKMICPLSMTTEPKLCHPSCKLNENGKCLLAEVLSKLSSKLSEQK